MYSRAPRELTQPRRETADHVGPGVYEIPDKKQGAGKFAEFRRNTSCCLFGNGFEFLSVFVEGYAPFLCMRARESIFQVADQVIVAPGPGHYNPVLPEKVKGCKAMANKVMS